MSSATYTGRDLEAMAFAPNYHGWILDRFRPYLGRRVAEVGAGTGNFARLLLAERIDALHLIEPSAAMFQQLSAIAEGESAGRVALHNAIFRGVAGQLQAAAVDSIIYVNVLEHIADDERELRAMSEVLPRGGRIFVFVPALPFLFGSHDRAVGHVRRYWRDELAMKCRAAGFAVLRADYFDVAGIVPWWLKYRVLQSNGMEPGAVRFYDRWIVPIMSRFEAWLPPPLGKNILLVAEKAS
jgi:SAM-dependent methyltransferase